MAIFDNQTIEIIKLIFRFSFYNEMMKINKNIRVIRFYFVSFIMKYIDVINILYKACHEQ